MTLVVLGGSGQLARSLAERAAARDVAISLVSRPKIDLADTATIAPALAPFGACTLINTAAYTAVDQAEEEPELANRINAEAPGEIARALAAQGGRLIHVSTDYVFDGTAGPYSEDAPTNPLGVYGATKRAGEQAVLAADPANLVVRTSWLVSPFGRNFVATMMALGGTRDELSVVDDQRGSPTNALDLADALLDLAGRPDIAGLLHVANRGEASWADLAKEVMDARREHGLPAARIKPITTTEWPAKTARPARSTLDTGRAAALGITLIDWHPSICAIVDRLVAE